MYYEKALFMMMMNSYELKIILFFFEIEIITSNDIYNLQ